MSKTIELVANWMKLAVRDAPRAHEAAQRAVTSSADSLTRLMADFAAKPSSAFCGRGFLRNRARNVLYFLTHLAMVCVSYGGRTEFYEDPAGAEEAILAPSERCSIALLPVINEFLDLFELGAQARLSGAIDRRAVNRGGIRRAAVVRCPALRGAPLAPTFAEMNRAREKILVWLQQINDVDSSSPPHGSSAAINVDVRVTPARPTTEPS